MTDWIDRCDSWVFDNFFLPFLPKQKKAIIVFDRATVMVYWRRTGDRNNWISRPQRRSGQTLADPFSR